VGWEPTARTGRMPVLRQGVALMKTWTSETQHAPSKVGARTAAVRSADPAELEAGALRRASPIRDPQTAALALAATLLGLVFVFDAGYARSLRDGHGLVPREFWMQILYSVGAIGIGWLCSRASVRAMERMARPLWTLTVLALAAVLVVGIEMNGATRWFRLGPITVQPAEFAKVAIVLYLAAVFARRKAWPTKLKAPKNWAMRLDAVTIPKLVRALPAVWVGLALLLTELEPDLGTGLILAGTAFAMFWAGGVTKRSLTWCLGIAAALIFLVIQLQPYRLERITAHFDRWNPAHVDGIAYQTVQSELAMASGGFVGVGMGLGRAKHVMPASTTDFIAATIGEEFGLLGWTLVAGVLFMLTLRLARLALRAPTRFGQLALMGFAAWIGIQSAVNLMMANGAFPAIGVPLPFVSSGGSSLVALWMAVGFSMAALGPGAPEAAAEPGRAVVRAAPLARERSRPH
jgi:cell division protein FtsW